MNHVVALALSYLIGSIPFGVIVARVFGGVDIRQHGSKSSGATNVLRTLGKKYGIMVFALDFLKGLVSVAVAQVISPHNPWIWALAATFSVVGHIFPLFVGFKGGRGVATGLGGLSMLVPIAVIASFAVWGLIVYTTRYVSLGSIVGSLTTIIVSGITLMIGWDYVPDFLYCLVTGSIIIWAHRDNIARLRAGTENRFGESKKSSSN